MRWGEIKSWSVRHCPVENPSHFQEVFPPLVSWKEGKASRKESSWGKQGPPSQSKWRYPRPDSWAGVPLTPGQSWNAPPCSHALRLSRWCGAGVARRVPAIVQISKPSPGASWCPPPCPELPPRGWQMLFHRLRRVGGRRKVLLGGSGGQRGRQQLPPSQSWLTVASQVPESPRPGDLG